MKHDLFFECLKYAKTHQNIYVACSGGSDSLALLHLAKTLGLNPKIAYFDHLDNPDERAFVESHAKKFNFDIVIAECPVKYENGSQKEFYRTHRYNFLRELDGLVLLGHTLDDVIETMIFSTLRSAECRFIPFNHANCIRPILSSKKEACINFLNARAISWYEDPTNSDHKYTRNFIRHEIIPLCYNVNEGLDTLAKKKVQLKIKEFKNGIANQGERLYI